MGGMGVEGGRGPSADELRAALRSLQDELRTAAALSVPDEPSLDVGGRLRRVMKTGQFRAFRPLSRRSDRYTAALAELTDSLAAVLSDRLAVTEANIRRLETLIADVRSGTPDDVPTGVPTVDDDFYWAFEARLRGSTESVLQRLSYYEHLVADLKRASDVERPLWLDIGCGKGEFCGLLRGWGFEVHGVDVSPAAVETCRAAGFEATVGDAIQFLQNYDGPAAQGVSAIQVVEHLPKHLWLTLFHAARKVVAPGGAFLLETINPLNVNALASSFFADVTHTWPAHPLVAQLMSERAGFDEARIIFLNEDERGSAWDFAIWATVAPATTGS